MDTKFPRVSNQPRERIKEEGVQEVFRRTSVVVRKRERELNCINYRAGCIFTPPPRYANIVSPCPPVCALGDLFISLRALIQMKRFDKVISSLFKEHDKSCINYYFDRVIERECEIYNFLNHLTIFFPSEIISSLFLEFQKFPLSLETHLLFCGTLYLLNARSLMRYNVLLESNIPIGRENKRRSKLVAMRHKRSVDKGRRMQRRRISHLHRNKLAGTIGSSVHSDTANTVQPCSPNRKPLQYALLTLSTQRGPYHRPDVIFCMSYNNFVPGNVFVNRQTALGGVQGCVQPHGPRRAVCSTSHAHVRAVEKSFAISRSRVIAA
ncbi:hypothetical protein ALC60_12655 [Trachymyrmex zeteki]|uniref:Uncharacterized protein n=1 Tax=Mycetomoellerius zeteki TaxID=64791 RepID=A0A151WKI9_9HYME|nr:hypothetical protein ALC60_12655 [Trachymyrmex zeteki]